MRRTLIFANGDLNDGAAVQAALDSTAYVIAADGGARLALQLERHIDLLIGDMDSLPPELVDQLAQQGTEIIPLPAEKNETDLEVALLEASQRGTAWIRIIGGLGGRLDQELANIYLLALPALQGVDACLVAGDQTARVLGVGRHPLEGQIGDTISLIPLSGAADGITTWGLQYPLMQETLHVGPARGISNVIQQTEAGVEVGSGLVLMVHTIGRA